MGSTHPEIFDTMKRTRFSPEKKKPPSKRLNFSSQVGKKRKKYTRTGLAGTFLTSTLLESTSEKDLEELLIGSIPKKSGNAAYENLTTITKFLADYNAMVTLNKTGTSESRIIPRYYFPTIQDFAKTQMERQSAGLTSNTNPKSSQEMTKVIESHATCLKAAMKDAFTSRNNDKIIFTKDDLCTWHGILSGENKMSMFRKSQARAGSTVFCPSSHIDREYELLCQCICELYLKWKMEPQQYSATEGGKTASAYKSVALAAIVLYGISDIHMFSDGNGRTSRILTNWILHRVLGLPFSITLSTNPQQRREYIDAVKQGLKVTLETKKTLYSKQKASLYEPIVHLLLDRIAHAIHECQRKLTEKSRVTLEEDEARITRKAREHAAQGHCIICLEDSPNIATLCCGQAVHLNCIAEWLANASNCVGCRAPLPPMRLRRPAPTTIAPQQQQQQQQQQRLQEEADDFTAQVDDNDENDDEMEIIRDEEVEESYSTMFLEEEEADTAAVEDEEEEESYTTTLEDEDDEDDDEEEDSDETTSIMGSSSEEVTTTSLSENNSSEETNPQNCHSHQSYCGNCSNRAAMDCVNRMCGRCCVLNGSYSCPRHNYR
jgi:hypothetical protein